VREASTGKTSPTANPRRLRTIGRGIPPHEGGLLISDPVRHQEANHRPRSWVEFQGLSLTGTETAESSWTKATLCQEDCGQQDFHVADDVRRR